MMKNKRKVSTLLLHRVQREIGLFVMVFLIITTLSVAFIIHWTLNEAVEQVGRMQMTGGAVEVLLIFKRILLDRIFVFLTAGVFIVGFFVVKALHRVAGPLNRITVTLRSIGEGHTPKEIELRERDYFLEVGEEVNRVIRRLKKERTDETRGEK